MGTLLRFVLRRSRRDCGLLLRLWGGVDWLRSLLRNLDRWRGRLLRHSWLYRCRRGWARIINCGFLYAFGKGGDIGSWRHRSRPEPRSVWMSLRSLQLVGSLEPE